MSVWEREEVQAVLREQIVSESGQARGERSFAKYLPPDEVEFMLITSRANPKIKEIRRLFTRKYRQRTGLFFVEGLQLVEEAVAMHADITTLVVAPELLSEESAKGLVSVRERAEVPCLEVTGEVFSSISPRDGQQGIGAVACQRWDSLDDIGPATDFCWVAADQIRHPGSLGTILRVCDAVGGEGVILIGDASDPYDPTAVRASLGAVFSQRLAKASFGEFAAWRQRQNCFVVGTSPTSSTDYRAVSYGTPAVLFMGSDRRGLSAEQQAICDVMVRIPMVGRCDSHHVAVATGIVLYEMFNQRGPAKNRVPHEHALS